MVPIIVEIWFLLLLLIQILHIFEELYMEVYQIKEFLTIKKYLIASSIIISISMLTFIVIILELVIGYIFGICVSIFGILNFYCPYSRIYDEEKDERYDCCGILYWNRLRNLWGD